LQDRYLKRNVGSGKEYLMERESFKRKCQRREQV